MADTGERERDSSFFFPGRGWSIAPWPNERFLFLHSLVEISSITPDGYVRGCVNAVLNTPTKLHDGPLNSDSLNHISAKHSAVSMEVVVRRRSSANEISFETNGKELFLCIKGDNDIEEELLQN